jgi:predicted ATP-binding protein involved in virulence
LSKLKPFVWREKLFLLHNKFSDNQYFSYICVLINQQTMLITHIDFKNFKPFKEVSFELNPHFNIIIGKNMSGKTSVLDGLSVAMGSFFLGMSGGAVKYILKEDIHLTTYQYSLEEQTPVCVAAKGVVDGNMIEWDRELHSINNGKTTRLGASKIKNIAKKLDTLRQKGKNVKLPILAYYPTTRNWKKINENWKNADVQDTDSRKEGYKSWSNPEYNIQMVLEWFRDMQLAAIQPNGKEAQNGDSVELKVLRICITTCIENAKDVFYDWKRKELMLEWQDDRKIPVSRLSHGVKNMMAIIADIAYRCMRLNPHLELNAAKETEGIVLIDELDAHLHPSWQLKIVDNLKKTFPKIQFVITTHSPLIIGSADANELIMLPENLSEGSLKPQEKSYKGWQLQFILEQIMDSESNYDVNIEPILNNLSESFEKNDLENYQKNLVVLKNVLNPNDAILKVYQMKLAILL